MKHLQRVGLVGFLLGAFIGLWGGILFHDEKAIEVSFALMFSSLLIAGVGIFSELT